MNRIICLFAAPLLFVPLIAGAVEGALEINQACIATSCFAGDTPGSPVQIVSTGSYVLTSNLQVSGSGAIVIGADGVRLDLQGFSIRGPVSCSGSPAVCTPDRSTDSGTGVTVPHGTRDVVIRNGTIGGFSAGILTYGAGIVEDMGLVNNSNQGIFSAGGAIIRRVAANGNGRVGVEGGDISDSVATDNGQFGFAIDGGIIRNSRAYRNASYGIYDWGRSLIKDCQINGNLGYGIYVENGGSALSGNIITANTGVGIHIAPSTAFEPAGVTTALSGNSLTGNNGGSQQAQIAGTGAKVFLSANLCGASTCQ